MNILVTGGAGYIGSHIVRLLGEHGYNLTVVDNLVTGFRESVLYGSFIKEDIGNREAMDHIFKEGHFDACIHCAASLEVEESVSLPLKYYINNTANSALLADLCIRHGVNRFIFSSSAAVYGNPEKLPVPENSKKEPINPYGASKLMIERILQDAASAVPDFRYCIFRYFNAAGADEKLRIGESTPHATHLIKLASRAALGIIPGLKVFGTGYSTADGTCVRDYIHVDDLALAHLKALEYLESHKSGVFNCGYGHGYSVLEVIKAVKEASGVDFSVENADPRPGDPDILIADSSLMKKETGWQPEHDDIGYICRTAFLWEKKLFERQQK